MYRFPGQRLLNWALVLPLAMPAYVLAYAYTDFLQVTGPVQTTLRELTGWGWRDYWFPNVRSLGGAVFVLTRRALPVRLRPGARGLRRAVGCALEVSRTLGCTPFAAFRRVGLPLARPAIAAGIAFVMMETLADFGAVAVLRAADLHDRIYRAWFRWAPAAAAQLASLLLLMVFGVLALEWAARPRPLRHHDHAHLPEASDQLTGWRGWAACAACSIPVLVGFVLPAIVLAWMALGAGDGIRAARLLTLTGNTALLGVLASS